MDIWMLIVEENKEFTEFSSVVSPYHEYVVYITETSGFLRVFLRASFSKFSVNMLAITGEIGELIAAPEVHKIVQKIDCYKRSK